MCVFKRTLVSERRCLGSARVTLTACLTLLFVFMILFDASSSSKYNRENWVNPDDMLNYDRASKTMLRPGDNRESWINPDTTNECKKDTEQGQLIEKLKECKATVLMYEKQQAPPPVSQCGPDKSTQDDSEKKRCGGGATKMEYQYLKRFVNMILQASELVDARLVAGESRQSLVSIDVTAEHLATLQQFRVAGSSVSLSEIDDVLSHILHSSNTGFYVPLGWLERFAHMFSSRDMLYRLVPCGITLVALVMLAMRRRAIEIVATFLILVLALSYQWTYNYMLKMAEIKQYVTLKKLNDIPASCRPSATFSLLEYLRSFFRSGTDDDCHKLYTVQMMDPALEVTPTIVLSEMLAAMLLHPAERVGDGIARFSGSILGGLPMFSNWIVLIMSFILVAAVVVVAVVVLCGGRLRLPYMLSGLEVTGLAPGPLPGARAPVQDIPTPVSANPFVSAISSSSEGLVLMNLPILERLMSARDDRPTQREYVERLVPSENPGRSEMTTSVCAQCQGSDEAEGSKLETHWREVGRSGDASCEKGGGDKIVPTSDRSKVVSFDGSRSGGGDCVRRVACSKPATTSLEKNNRPSTFVHLASGDNVNVTHLLDVKTEEDKLGVRLREGNSERGPNVSSDEGKEVNSTADDPLDRSEFIDELRKILEEQDSIEGESAMTEAGRTREVASVKVRDVELARQPDISNTLESLLEECRADATTQIKAGSSVGKQVSGESDPEFVRKSSSDSSDASGDFVKL